jgi:hypothetical protein
MLISARPPRSCRNQGNGARVALPHRVPARSAERGDAPNGVPRSAPFPSVVPSPSGGFEDTGLARRRSSPLGATHVAALRHRLRRVSPAPVRPRASGCSVLRRSPSVPGRSDCENVHPTRPLFLRKNQLRTGDGQGRKADPLTNWSLCVVVRSRSRCPSGVVRRVPECRELANAIGNFPSRPPD